LIIIFLFLSSCRGSTTQEVAAIPSLQPVEIIQSDGIQAIEHEPFYSLGLTQHNLDGNRYVPGQIDLLNANVLDIPLEERPLWVLGMGLGPQRSIWLAALEDGRVQAFEIAQGQVAELIDFGPSLTPGEPPALAWIDGELLLLNSLSSHPNAFNHPIFNIEQLIEIDPAGQLLLDGAPIAEGLLPDGRILADGSGQFLLLSDPSPLYDHGVLGDASEARALTLLEIASVEALQFGQLSGGQVYEAIAPIWADLDQNGVREILVTLSDAQNGAQLLLYSEDGNLLAESAPIGLGYRWRNQLAIAPLGPNGELEIVDVRTPHIGGQLEFFRWEGSDLQIVASLNGVTSHVIGSRNLDLGLAADVNADGRVEVLLPSQDLASLIAVKRTNAGADAILQLELGSRLSSNIASARFADGSLALGVGLESGYLRVWLP